MRDKIILAEFDNEGVYVYQAFKPSIVQAALAHGTFHTGFNRERMTWIKPSFGWMLHRSNYATAHRQEAILKIKITHEGFLTILQEAIPTTHQPHLWETRTEWRDALHHSKARYQWDPDRDLYDHKLERRAIQLGIRGWLVHQYVDEWIIRLEEVTELAHAIKQAIQQKQPLPDVPELQEYPVSPELARRLTM